MNSRRSDLMNFVKPILSRKLLPSENDILFLERQVESGASQFYGHKSSHAFFVINVILT